MISNQLIYHCVVCFFYNQRYGNVWCCFIIKIRTGIQTILAYNVMSLDYNAEVYVIAYALGFVFMWLKTCTSVSWFGSLNSNFFYLNWLDWSWKIRQIFSLYEYNPTSHKFYRIWYLFVMSQIDVKWRKIYVTSGFIWYITHLSSQDTIITYSCYKISFNYI